MILCAALCDKRFNVLGAARFRRAVFKVRISDKFMSVYDIRRGGYLIKLQALLLCGITLLALSFSQSAEAGPTITGARAGESDEATRFVLDLSANARFRIYTLAAPYRLVIDLPGVGWALNGKQINLDRGLVGILRYGQFRPDTARIVVDLKAAATVNQAFVLPPGNAGRHRLVIDLKPVSNQAFRSSTITSLEGTAHATERSKPVPTSADKQNNRPAASPTDRVLLPSPARPKPADKTSRGQQLVVIDAGHGGADPGAVVDNNTYEKHITLAAARALEIMLIERGYNVVLSRRADKYLSLAARVELAQSRKADLFISLHADKHQSLKVRGAAVYTLSETASDAETEALAARENEVDALFDVSNSDNYEADVRKILISLVQRTTMTCSAKFAGELIPELKKSTKLLRRTHRFAGFRVLKAPDVPSVLVEMGYMSNGQDRKMLLSAKGRYALMRRVAQAIDDYFLHHATCSQAS